MTKEEIINKTNQLFSENKKQLDIMEVLSEEIENRILEITAKKNAEKVAIDKRYNTHLMKAKNFKAKEREKLQENISNNKSKFTEILVKAVMLTRENQMTNEELDILIESAKETGVA